MIDLSATSVGVLGAGTMGQGIAQVCASAGCQVFLFDINEDALSGGLRKITEALDTLVSKGKISGANRSAVLSRIKPASALQNITAHIVIEAVIENLEAKQDLFSRLEESVSPETLLLTNTSSIQISAIASALKIPSRFAGLHFFNPAPVMKLVEVVQGRGTHNATVDRVREFAAAIGKQPVVTQDSPGFIVNRVARPFYVEALHILEEGVADHETIDLMLRNIGFRMGPFELMDLIGLDVNLSVTKSIYHAFRDAPRFRPSSIQQRKVDAGMLGRKSGKGFYDYN